MSRGPGADRRLGAGSIPVPAPRIQPNHPSARTGRTIEPIARRRDHRAPQAQRRGLATPPPRARRPTDSGDGRFGVGPETPSKSPARSRGCCCELEGGDVPPLCPFHRALPREGLLRRRAACAGPATRRRSGHVPSSTASCAHGPGDPVNGCGRGQARSSPPGARRYSRCPRSPSPDREQGRHDHSGAPGLCASAGTRPQVARWASCSCARLSSVAVYSPIAQGELLGVEGRRSSGLADPDQLHWDPEPEAIARPPRLALPSSL
jgi:hypothetical protein